MRLTLRGTLSYTGLQLSADGPGNGAGVKLDVYFAFETVKKGKDWRGKGERWEEEEEEEEGVLLLWNDINVQKWFHMQRLNRRGLGRPSTGPAPGK